MQILILLSAMLASLTGLAAGERQIARAQVERSISARAAAAQAEAEKVAARPVIKNQRRVIKTRTETSRSNAGAAEPRPCRSILLLKRAWLE